MANTITTQPEPVGSGEAHPSILRRGLHAILGLLALGAVSLAIWPSLLEYIPGAEIESFGGAQQFRIMAGVAFATLMLVRFLIRPPREASRRSIVWGQFASQVGGTLTSERRKLGPMGWEGGTTVRWTAGGIEANLCSSTDTSGNGHTQFAADIRMNRGFQFQVVHQSLITKALFSQQLWEFALSNMKTQAKVPPGAPDPTERMAFLAEKEILIGDARFDAAFLLKSDGPDRAREFFGDAGVAYALHELNGINKGWQMSLMNTDSSGTHRLSLAIPGIVVDPQTLKAGRRLVEASIRCCADRGMLAPGKTQAA
ncbi:MAG TPA: hypothetical protein VGK76_11085 [Candidatus Eisenbacteria bacterium]|jgi:hypothetical protein